MKVISLREDQVVSVDWSPFLHVQRREDGLYDYDGETFGASLVDPQLVMVLPDEVEVSVGDSARPEWAQVATPLDWLIRATPAQAAADALGLVMRQGIAEGAISDGELLRIAPA